MSSLDGVEIAIVAPCPRADLAHEGWMSRIRAIDRQFNGRKRVYLNFSEHHPSAPSGLTWHAAERAEILLRPGSPACEQLVARVVQTVRVVYVHTLHLAEFMLPHLPSGKLCVDIHGITPEEEVMMGRPELRPKYEAVERQVLAEAKHCICVSNAMIAHYAEKYPTLNPNWITIPIIEAYPEEPGAGRRTPPDGEPPAAIYSGGTQAWQNIDAMLSLAKNRGREVSFRFLSHDFELIRRRAAEMEAEAEFAYCSKVDLPAAYRSADFGLVLRDDTAVNRVSCPTKLVEYLQFGVVPIVRSPALGDFAELGFAYVTEEEFASGFFPDAASREWMIERNLEVIWALADRFRKGIAALHASIWNMSEVDGSLTPA
ncbi:hypothetical protein GGR16_001051 [Chelatococcus caeni]|uniref:Glycosyltransferase subfamily 4-like N-terminal domain-containing protein n=1 Tax=Chelatococcus caeni TaxID=1348468 RepID=A0A840BRP0_9HYPH|nr:hypothetical protein [Chelatococcus caeni]MBB4016045.1 hypothetical protein [Chelatococcus caeni]